LFNELKQSLSASSNSNTTSQTNEKKEEKGKKKKNSTNNDDIQLVWPTVDYVKVRFSGSLTNSRACKTYINTPYNRTASMGIWPVDRSVFQTKI
jgi:hypothetical protein